MPIYEFQCAKCKKVSEFIQKISDPTPTECPQCSASNTLSKLVSQTSFILKGGGWYSDAYGDSSKAKKTSKPSGSGDSGSSSGESGGSSSSPASSSGSSTGSGGGGDGSSGGTSKAEAKPSAHSACGRCEH